MECWLVYPWGYSSAYVVSAVIQLLSVPFLLLARREKASSDRYSTSNTPLNR